MCYNTIMEPEIRKETQDLEIKKDTPKASAPTPRERFAGIYPDADPRKFNSHTTEQEIAVLKTIEKPIKSISVPLILVKNSAK